MTLTETKKERELRQITERLETIIENGSSWVYEFKGCDFQTQKTKDTTIGNVLEYLKYDNGSQFKSYSIFSRRILIGQTLYTF
jgi:hypothetical protein